MPLPNHKAIPDGWSAHHAPVVRGTMTATGVITLPASAGDATFDETAGRTIPAQPTVIYDPGPMRVQRLSNATSRQVEVGGRTVTVRTYQISLPLDGPLIDVPGGAIVIVTECDDDPTLIGRPLHVQEAPPGSLMWHRIFRADDLEPTHR